MSSYFLNGSINHPIHQLSLQSTFSIMKMSFNEAGWHTTPPTTKEQRTTKRGMNIFCDWLYFACKLPEYWFSFFAHKHFYESSILCFIYAEICPQGNDGEFLLDDDGWRRRILRKRIRILHGFKLSPSPRPATLFNNIYYRQSTVACTCVCAVFVKCQNTLANLEECLVQ